MEVDDGVKQNYERFQNISILKEDGEVNTVSLFSKI